MRIVARVLQRLVERALEWAEDAVDAGFRAAAWVAALHAPNPGRQLAVVVLALAGTAVFPVSTPYVPSRVVHLPSGEWADGATVAGLSAQAPDGADLRYAWGDPAEGVSRQTTLSPEIAAGQVALGGKVHLNAASIATLERLPGVGPALAARIVAARPFHQTADLDRVKGIGEKTFAKLAPLVEP